MLCTGRLFDSFLQNFGVVFLGLLVILKLVGNVSGLVGEKRIFILEPLDLVAEQHFGFF